MNCIGATKDHSSCDKSQIQGFFAEFTLRQANELRMAFADAQRAAFDGLPLRAATGFGEYLMSLAVNKSDDQSLREIADAKAQEPVAEFEHFSFQSTWATAIQLKGFGLGIIIWSIAIIANSTASPSPDEVFSIWEVPFHLMLWILGAYLYLAVCEVDINKGQLRYRRFLKWKSAPLDSIIGVRQYGPVICLTLGPMGKTERLLFNLGWTAGQSYPPQVVGFLQRVAAGSRG